MGWGRYRNIFLTFGQFFFFCSNGESLNVEQFVHFESSSGIPQIGDDQPFRVQCHFILTRKKSSNKRQLRSNTRSYMWICWHSTIPHHCSISYLPFLSEKFCQELRKIFCIKMSTRAFWTSKETGLKFEPIIFSGYLIHDHVNNNWTIILHFVNTSGRIN